MRYFFTVFFLVFLTMGLAVNDVAAKRFGGGRMFSGQRAKGLFSTSFTKKTNTHANRGATINNKSRGFWRGMLLGGLLTSLFMGHHFAGTMMSLMLMIACLLFVANLWRRKRDIYYRPGS